MSKLIPLAVTKKRLTPFMQKTVTRKLPQPGKILVKPQDQVAPEDIIGECDISAGFRIFSIPEILAIKPEETARYFTKKVGQRVYRGEVLATSQKWLGVSKREFLSPINGNIINLDQNGRLTLQYLPSHFRLVSGVKGVVTEVKNGQNIVIETEAAVLQGAMGVGYERDGAIEILKGEEDKMGGAYTINAQHEGKIVIAPSIITREMIQRALTVGVRGVIGGSMRVRDFINVAGSLSPLEDIGISLMVVGSFGDLPMERSTMDFLTEFEHRYAIIDPLEKNLLIPLYGKAKERALAFPSKAQTIETIQVGVQVRILYWPHFGRVGTLTEIRNEETLIDSGLKVPTCTIELAGNIKTSAPLRNIEIV